MHLRNENEVALFRCFDGIGTHAVQVDAPCNGSLRHHRAQTARAKLRRLLNEIIKARVFEWRKNIVDVWRWLHFGRLALDAKRDCLLADAGQVGEPFPVAAIEQRNRISRFQAQDIGKVMRLRISQGHVGSGRQPGFDTETGSGLCHAARVSRRP